MFDHKSLNSRQDRWVAFLSEYDIEIRHIKGKENIVADALSRQKHELHFVLVSEYESEFKNMLKTMSICDDEYKELMGKCKNRVADNKDNIYQIDTEGFF